MTVTQSPTRTAARLVAEARQRIENLTPDPVAAELATGLHSLSGSSLPHLHARTEPGV